MPLTSMAPSPTARDDEDWDLLFGVGGPAHGLHALPRCAFESSRAKARGAMAALRARPGKNAAVSLAEQGSRRDLAELIRAERQAMAFENLVHVENVEVFRQLDIIRLTYAERDRRLLHGRARSLSA